MPRQGLAKKHTARNVPMSEAHRRPKTPDQTRLALLDAAARLAMDHGFSALSLPAVCDSAGVTKGALFHQQAKILNLFTEDSGLSDRNFEAIVLRRIVATRDH